MRQASVSPAARAAAGARSGQASVNGPLRVQRNGIRASSTHCLTPGNDWSKRAKKNSPETGEMRVGLSDEDLFRREMRTAFSENHICRGF